MSDTNVKVILSAISELELQLPRLSQQRKTDFSTYFASLADLNPKQASVVSMLSAFSKQVLDAKLKVIEYSGWLGFLRGAAARKAQQKYQELLQQETIANQAYTAYLLKLSNATGLPVSKSWLANEKVEWSTLESELTAMRNQLEAVRHQPKHAIERQVLYAIDAKRYELFKQFINGNRYLMDLKVKSIEEGLAFSPEYVQGSQASERVAASLEKIRQDVSLLLAR